jgi:serine protease Do
MKRLVVVLVLIAALLAGVRWLSQQMPTPTTSGTVSASSAASTSTEKERKITSTFTPESKPVILDGDVPLLDRMNQEFDRIVQNVLPSVVSIVVYKDAPQMTDLSELFPQMPAPFRQPGAPQRKGGKKPPQAEAGGSGVIISREGHIITNQHVVDKANKIEVELHDGRHLSAKVVGQDELADIAVLKIEADNLKALPLGDSDNMKVGAMVIAVGSPFGFSESVSRGIISAIGRNPQFSRNNYENYLQTDAAINPGNSGGALVNVRGELIGINTAIASRSGGFQGIGFAIPSNLAKFALDSLIKSGKVVRGYLGVGIQEITAEAKDLWDLKTDHGALVSEVNENTPAAKAGIERGDVIVEFDGKPVRDTSTLRLAVSQTPVGKEVPLKIFRAGKEKSLTLIIGELPGSLAKTTEGNSSSTEEDAAGNKTVESLNNALAGIKVQNLTPDIRKQFGVPDALVGVIIAEVAEDSLAAGKGLKPGDVIQELKLSGQPGLQKVTDVKSYLALAKR